MPPDEKRQLTDHSGLIQFFAKKPDLLLTNDAPPEQDRNTLQILIASADHNMLAYDTEPKELYAKIASSRMTRNAASRVLKLSKNILSPIRRLPREVIAEIVLHALQIPKLPEWSVVATLDTRTGPWKYGQVCRIWREAVLNYPQLWTHFRFDQATTPPSMAPRMYEGLMQMIIQRSQQLPISFVFDEQALYESAGALRILVGECHRWKDVDLTIDGEGSFVGLDAVRGKLPCLERLCLNARFGLLNSAFDDHYTWSGYEERIKSLSMHGFAEAPRLRRLKLDLHMDGMDLSFSVEQVESYEERDCETIAYQTSPASSSAASDI